MNSLDDFSMDVPSLRLLKMAHNGLLELQGEGLGEGIESCANIKIKEGGLTQQQDGNTRSKDWQS